MTLNLSLVVQLTIVYKKKGTVVVGYSGGPGDVHHIMPQTLDCGQHNLFYRLFGATVYMLQHCSIHI